MKPNHSIQISRQIELRPIASLRPSARNARTHSKAQVAQIARSIEQFGFTNPVLIDEKGGVLAGHGRLRAAAELRLDEIPTLCIAGLSAAQRRALMLADNKIAENAGWDRDLLAVELGELTGLLDAEGLDITLTGFDAAEIDALAADLDDQAEPDDQVPAAGDPAVEKGDHWLLGRHRLICADARDEVAVARLMDGAQAQMVFIDPPYNVPVLGHVQGRGAIKHREFAFASGEMSAEAFTTFLTESLAVCERNAVDGSIHFVCMDWRHVGELMTAGTAVFSELKNLCVWVKSNAGQGSFYRSQHELVFVFKKGEDAHVNNFGLGQSGRSRSNVWHYAGINSFRAGRLDELKMHPTVKPVALVADAIRDCSRRGDIVLDTFMGSGTTMMAAERLGRRAFGVEIDPVYVDVAIRRWLSVTKADAVLAETGETYAEVARRRQAVRESHPTASAPPELSPEPALAEEDSSWVDLCGGAR
ncbi:DNA methyltransferase [Bosea sp. (in: a-proteobacteria)]|uniref:site-specific DNA-methyltransferase n=1 Tax=Bosea sp. (in: a-proteobacteria) TaxID=1871050 RepID=UPI0026211D6C|nr:DNA methyltransferase [Bosea sp. (in: a-proteobacteria)]MCO5091725.1 ParB N-terminal domain-containing protein [Bosea sp. (in: a-proteobacteria)]